MNNKEAPIARVNKATTGEWKIIEIQKDRRLFGQNHNTLIEHTVSKKRKVVEGVLGKPGEVISL